MSEGSSCTQSKTSSTTDHTSENEEDVVKELEKIKGDAIGDTAYSERWVLRVLIKLSEITDTSWDKDLEEMLCSLWDMAVEKDVVHFLLSNDFYNLFCKVIRSVNNARCIEIMVGIVGNMCCVEDALVSLSHHNASLLVINLITSEDSLVLVQVLRLLNSCLWALRVEEPDTATRCNSPSMSPVNERIAPPVSVPLNEEKTDSAHPWLDVITPHKDLVFRHLLFFLSSAINEELLCSSLELLDTVLAIPSWGLVGQASSSAELAAGLAECLRQLLRGTRVGDCMSANRRLWRTLQVWIRLVGYVASCQEGRLNLGVSGDILTKCFTKLTILLTTPEALKTQPPEIATLCLSVLETLPQIRVSSSVIARLTAVLYQLDQDMEELTRDSEDSLEVQNLLHRGVQFLKQRVAENEDIVMLLQSLPNQLQAFLISVAEHDAQLRNRLERGLLQIRTNGLVQ